MQLPGQGEEVNLEGYSEVMSPWTGSYFPLETQEGKHLRCSSCLLLSLGIMLPFRPRSLCNLCLKGLHQEKRAPEAVSRAKCLLKKTFLEFATPCEGLLLAALGSENTAEFERDLLEQARTAMTQIRKNHTNEAANLLPCSLPGDALA